MPSLLDVNLGSGFVGVAAEVLDQLDGNAISPHVGGALTLEVAEAIGRHGLQALGHAGFVGLRDGALEHGAQAVVAVHGAGACADQRLAELWHITQAGAYQGVQAGGDTDLHLLARLALAECQFALAVFGFEHLSRPVNDVAFWPLQGAVGQLHHESHAVVRERPNVVVFVVGDVAVALALGVAVDAAGPQTGVYLESGHFAGANEPAHAAGQRSFFTVGRHRAAQLGVGDQEVVDLFRRQVQRRHGRAEEGAQRAWLVGFVAFALGAGDGLFVVLQGALGQRASLHTCAALLQEHVEPIHQGTELSIGVVEQPGALIGFGLVGAQALPLSVAVDVVIRPVLLIHTRLNIGVGVFAFAAHRYHVNSAPSFCQSVQSTRLYWARCASVCQHHFGQRSNLLAPPRRGGALRGDGHSAFG